MARGEDGQLMHSSVEQRRELIAQLCRTFHVKRLELFGSAARDETGAEPRDLDLFVEFAPLPPGERARAYFGLLDALEQAFEMPVDLVVARAVANRRFLAATARERTALYAS